MRCLFSLTVLALVAAADGDWVEYKPKDGKFTVSFPAKPDEETLSPKGVPYKIHKVAALGADTSAYLLMYMDGVVAEKDLKEAGSGEKFIEGMIKGHINGRKGKVLKADKLTLDKHPGRAATFQTEDNTFISIRAYYVNNRAYMLMVEADDAKALGAKDVETYFGSFKLGK